MAFSARDASSSPTAGLRAAGELAAVQRMHSSLGPAPHSPSRSLISQLACHGTRLKTQLERNCKSRPPATLSTRCSVLQLTAPPQAQATSTSRSHDWFRQVGTRQYLVETLVQEGF